ncbi:gamma-tubulin [Conglomerata obtusa]
MRENLVIQVGQCGNQIGNEFWEKIAFEHGINKSGLLVNPNDNDRKDAFFYETDDNRFIPRSILIDLEPRVMQSIPTSFYNEDNIFLDATGGGAGNNWAHGYSKGKEYQNDVLEMIQREFESCDNLETFMLIHSIAGGTGSGFGSLILENIREFYPKKLIHSYSIFPNNEEVSDVVVQPYNSMLTLQRLSLCCDSVVVMDNSALTRINNKCSLRNKRMNIHENNAMNYSMINSLISTVLSASTSTLRFPSYMMSDMRSINNILVPVDRLKFVVPSYTPFLSDTGVNRKTDSHDIINKLLLPSSKLATMDISHTDHVISMLSILRGVNSKDIQKSVVNIFDKGELNFVSWMPPSFHVVKSGMTGTKSGVCLHNTTGIVSLLTKICEQFDRLKKKNAFIDIYKKFSADLSEFDECREVVQNVIDAYNNV